MPTLVTDESPMPFGKHKGEKMQDVPPSYLLWLWDEGGVWQDKTHKLHTYIKESFSALEMDSPNVIIKHRP